MQALSPLRRAQDQAVIGACLAEAMAASGARVFLSGAAAPLGSPLTEEIVGRAQTMREEARFQRDLAHEMLRANAEIVSGWRSSRR